MDVAEEKREKRERKLDDETFDGGRGKRTKEGRKEGRKEGKKRKEKRERKKRKKGKIVVVRYRVEWNLLGLPLSDSVPGEENASYVEAHRWHVLHIRAFV